MQNDIKTAINKELDYIVSAEYAGKLMKKLKEFDQVRLSINSSRQTLLKLAASLNIQL